jgi:hypothetical protein
MVIVRRVVLKLCVCNVFDAKRQIYEFVVTKTFLAVYSKKESHKSNVIFAE